MNSGLRSSWSPSWSRASLTPALSLTMSQGARHAWKPFDFDYTEVWLDTESGQKRMAQCNYCTAPPKRYNVTELKSHILECKER